LDDRGHDVTTGSNTGCFRGVFSRRKWAAEENE